MVLKRNNIMKFTGKWTELEEKKNLSDVFQTQKDKTWYIFAYKWILAVKSMITNLQSIESQRVSVSIQGSVLACLWGSDRLHPQLQSLRAPPVHIH